MMMSYSGVDWGRVGVDTDTGARCRPRSLESVGILRLGQSQLTTTDELTPVKATHEENQT